MSYKSKATSNRDALFGGASGSGSKTKSGNHNDNAPQGTKSTSTSQGYKYGAGKSSAGKVQVGLSGEAKAAKLKEAEEYRDKASTIPYSVPCQFYNLALQF